jgi:hypothetical protein
MFRQDQDAVYDAFIDLLSEEYSEKPLYMFRYICFGSQKLASSSADSHHLNNNWEGSRSRRRRLYRARLAEILLIYVQISYVSCDECYQRFRASWNSLSAHRRLPPAQNFQAPTREVSECAICFDGQRDFLLVPCGHRSCFEKCTDEILREKGHCPLSGKQRVHDV